MHRPTGDSVGSTSRPANEFHVRPRAPRGAVPDAGSTGRGRGDLSPVPGRLEIEGGGAAGRALPLDRVRAVHLKHVRGRNYRYFQCIVRTDADQLVVGHLPRGRAGRDDGGEEYAAFVRELLRALSHGPQVQFKAGSMGYFAYVAAVLAFAGWFALIADPWLAAVALAAGLATGVSTLWPSRPRTFDPAHPPAGLFPR